MPRATHSRRASSMASNGLTTTTDVIEKEPTVTATTVETEEDTVRSLPFEVAISDAPEGYRPDRSPAGRKRIPSPFEPILPDLKGKGWKNQPHDGKVVPFDSAEDGTPKFNTLASSPKSKDGSESGTIPSVKDSNAAVILRELSKAVKWLNTEEGGELNLGLDVNVTATDVQFNIRDKQKRKPKNAPGGGDVSDGERDDDDSDSDTDSGDE